MKVLQLGKYYPPDIGGIELVMYDISTQLLKYSDVSCDVLCSSKKKQGSTDVVDGVKVERAGSLGRFMSTSMSPVFLKKLAACIDGYDIIHVHLPDPLANMALFFAYTKGKKIVLHWHSDIVKQKMALKFYSPFLKWLIKRSDAIIVTSSQYGDSSSFLLNVQEKIYCIPIGIESNKLVPSKGVVDEIRRNFKGRDVVFSLGRLVYYKGFEFLIESAKLLPEGTVVLIGGCGEEKERLQEKIIRDGLEGKVELLGYLSDEEIAAYYQECKVFVLPSVERTEAFGIVQVEAMSFGKPVVSTSIPGSGVGWVNENGVSGITVRPKDAVALAEAIEKMVSDDGFYNELSSGAFKRYSDNFTRQAMVSNIYSLYRKLV